MTDKTIQVPMTGDPVPATVAPPTTVGQDIQNSLEKLGQAMHSTAQDLGMAAGRAADHAVDKLAPVAKAAEKSVDATLRDLDVAASTVHAGCGDIAQAAWQAMSDGNFGLAGEILKSATGPCSDSVSASLMALFPWVN